MKPGTERREGGLAKTKREKLNEGKEQKRQYGFDAIFPIFGISRIMR